MRRGPAERLRLAIECLPPETKEAMLTGVRDERIIVGAYTDRHGGVCPMLAAHRRGGRTSFASFARAWDRYTGVGKRARTATDRELLTLASMLESSLSRDRREYEELDRAVAEHRAILARRRGRAAQGEGRAPAPAKASRADTGERNRTPELRWRPGWAWLRLFRRYDEYQAALSAVNRADEAPPPSRRQLERV